MPSPLTCIRFEDLSSKCFSVDSFPVWDVKSICPRKSMIKCMQKSDQFEEVMLNVKLPRGKNIKPPN